MSQTMRFAAVFASSLLFSPVTRACRAVRCRPAAAIAVAVLGLVACCFTSMPLTAQEAQGRPVKDPAREAWRKAMVQRPLPRNGCFTANYPETEWHEVKCVPPPTVYYPPQGRGGNGHFTVGNGTDWSAQSAGLINSAEGSFLSVNGGASVSAFSLQVNPWPFNTTACNGGNAGCQGWAQFILSQAGVPPSCAGTPCIFIEYWLLGYGLSCPAGQPWQSDGAGDCVFNTPASLVSSPITAADLPNLTLTGTANAGGQDVVALGISGAPLTAVAQDSAVVLSAGWNTVEFNVFGDSNLHSNAAFSTPTTIDLETAINDGTTNPPLCRSGGVTAETNSLNLADVTGSSTLVCCPYGGTSPRIEFMETNAGHTATCGPTRIEGDPHITTADGTHYDFQGAGEFISLRDPDGAEIQTRQRPIATTGLGTDAHDGLSTCVSLNGAVAARVGEHRVTYEPNLNGRPDPTGLQLRIDGVLTSLGPYGINLGNGSRVVQSLTGGNLEVDFPDGKTLFVTPQFWTTYGQWYLNVDVTNAGLVSTDGGGTAARGIAGPIPSGSWLPSLPSGASMGPMPAGLPQRYSELYHKFADAWRVTKKDSLFDYAPGTSTDTFTDKSWPLEKAPCVVPETKPVEPTSLEIAQTACRRVIDVNRHADCIFDVRATGNTGFATTYLVTQRILQDSSTISLTDDPEPSQLGESVTFTAYVAANGSATGYPSGSVQFAVDGMNVAAPVTVDAKGRATWETTALKVGKHQITATYAPGVDSVFLPSSSVAKIHIVKRCPCGDRK
jgi:predicted secreted protein